MAFQSILNTAFPLPMGGGNSTDPSGSPILSISPTTLLETFIPGYGPIHKFLLYTIGFDVTILVSLGAALWIGTRICRSVWKVIWSLISDNYMSEISVSSTDEIHGHLLQFLAHKYILKPARRLMAETPSKSAWEVDEETETLDSPVDADGNIKWLNFSNQDAKSIPRFTPAIGYHEFWHEGTYYHLERKEVAMFDDLGGGGSSFKDKEILKLSCFGRSTEPIKKLIQHAKAHYHLGHNAKTVIKRPAPKDLRRFGGRGSWVKIAERPCRPMKTVVLDEVRKMDVLADINEYLNPATARWYANRGIPYRRGYLFYGPPGTGKTLVPPSKMSQPKLTYFQLPNFCSRRCIRPRYPRRFPPRTNINRRGTRHVIHKPSRPLHRSIRRYRYGRSDSSRSSSRYCINYRRRIERTKRCYPHKSIEESK